MKRSLGATSGDLSASFSRRAAARAVAAEIASRWDSGEMVTEAQAVAEHPLLTPELLEELRSVRLIHSALLAARRAGEIRQPMRILTAAELESPIEVSEDESTEEAPSLQLRIEGYFLLEVIRQGGQATVFQGVQEATGRAVAIKVMKGGALALSRHRARFDREVQILARLDHRNIVGILDRGRAADGSFFLAMEYVEGPDLDEYCRQLAMTEEGTRQLLRLFIKIARAVGVAHSFGIVHRDLKPSNIRVDAQGEPRLLDFGLARLVEEDPVARGVTLSGQIVGSVPWASPEQADGSMEVTGASDIYSLGVNLYQMLTRQFPYPVEGPLHEALSNIAHAQPLPPSRVRPARPFKHQAVLDAIVLKALAKDQKGRYSSATALASDLECILEDRRASVIPRRRRGRLYVIAAGVLALVLSVIAWFAARPTPPAVSQFTSFTNTVGMRLVDLPGGETVTNKTTTASSYYVRASALKAFSISATEVTQRQFTAVMGFNPSDQRWIGAELPVQMVTWDEAAAFCQKLSAKEHRPYRLPAKAEWQYAARAGTDHRLAPSELGHAAWYRDNSAGRPHAVGQLWANQYGLYDMYGGVSEWVGDEQAGANRTICGGSFLSVAEECRLAACAYVRNDARRPDIGFRVVLSRDPDKK